MPVLICWVNKKIGQNVHTVRYFLYLACYKFLILLFL